MRLQVAIHRNTLPAVNIIYNTSSSPTPIRTISEFLAAIDRVVPLESVDGEWGFEDYIVEVAATSDQTKLYECLHYQLIKDVFSEDDEIVIRGLSSDEVRERRQGGRLQILPDGRHLFDGVAWGRRYNPAAYRPGIEIPPRKRRRLLAAEEEEDEAEDEAVRRLEYHGSNAMVGTMIEDEDEEDTEDDEDYEDSDVEDDSEDKTGDQPRQIVARQEFDDADTDSNGHEAEDLDHQQQASDLEEDELQLLLAEAEEIEEAYHSLPLEYRITPPSKKRKRQDEKEVRFEGFPLASENRGKQAKMEQKSERSPRHIGDHVVTEPKKAAPARMNGDIEHISIVEDNSANNYDLSSDSDSQSDSESFIGSDQDTTSSDDDSSTGTSSSGSDSESVSGSETSSSGESESESETDLNHTTVANPRSFEKPQDSTPSNSEPATTPRADNPPGTGTKRTRANNNRIKLRKRLAHLKEQGILPPEADFSTLRVYEAGQDMSAEQDDNELGSSISPQLAQRKEELLARLSAVYENDTAMDGLAETTARQETENTQSQNLLLPTSIVQSPAEPDNIQIPIESPQKRARLDVESSRRMLFSSLGLRNPKTPAAEQALREKLSKPARTIVTRQPEDHTAVLVSASDDSWKDKLIISAVECVQEGLVLTPPPFPFKQRWGTDAQKKKACSSEHYNEAEYQADNHTEAPAHVVDSSQPKQAGLPPESQLVSMSLAGFEISPYPTDIENYPALTLNDVKIGTVIAYKQLQINAKFEPETSPYRVACITAIDGDILDLVLSKSDRHPPATNERDDKDVSKEYNKFEMPGGEDEYTEDDGLREATFVDMIYPKLIQAADTRHHNIARNVDTDASALHVDDTAVVPESVPLNDAVGITSSKSRMSAASSGEVNTDNFVNGSRLNAMTDEELLQPIDMPKTHEAVALSIIGSGADSYHTPQKSEHDPNRHSVDTRSALISSTMGSKSDPNMSQAGLGHSEVVVPTESSANQDAQPVSQVPSNGVNSDFSQLHVQRPFSSGSEADVSVQSEVIQPQLNSEALIGNIGTEHNQGESLNVRDDDQETKLGSTSQDNEIDDDAMVAEITPHRKSRLAKGKVSHHPLSPFVAKASSPSRSSVQPNQEHEHTHSESVEDIGNENTESSPKPGFGAGRVFRNALAGLGGRRTLAGKNKTRV